jgi:hypothetical protein
MSSKKIIKKILKIILPRKLINTLIAVRTDIIDVLCVGGFRKNLLKLQQLKQMNAYLIHCEKGMNHARTYLLGLNRNEQDAETLKIIEFLEKSNPFLLYAYDFIKEYNPLSVNVLRDETCDMNYVLHDNKRLYFPQTFDTERCRSYYNTLCIEQDIRSPHRYDTDEFTVKKCDVIADVGAAEGIWALTHVELAERIYLFECNREWIAALQKTFEMWKDKVVIINQYLSNVSNKECITFDDFINGEKIDVIKADIEGAELNMLTGSEKTLTSAVDLKLLLCTYHRNDDAEKIKLVLENNGFSTEFSNGYMFSPSWSMGGGGGGFS